MTLQWHYFAFIGLRTGVNHNSNGAVHTSKQSLAMLTETTATSFGLLAYLTVGLHNTTPNRYVGW